MKTYSVGIIGATGMVGQRFLSLLKNHPWFKVNVLAASSKSAGRPYVETVQNRWKLNEDVPEKFKNMLVMDGVRDIKKIVDNVDFVFCAVDMDKSLIVKLEQDYAKLECPVISNNSAQRFLEDVPMVIPEVNFNHFEVIEFQKKRLKTKKGFVAVKSNCSIQSYVPAIAPLLEYEPTKICVATYQAISGAGKIFKDWPEIVDNVIPYIGGEDEKSEKEPLKIFGNVVNGKIELNKNLKITAQCFRVPVSDGHTAAVFVDFKNRPAIDEIKLKWQNFKSKPQEFNLPTAPSKFLHYFEQNDRPQAKLDRDLEKGMAISLGRLREDSIFGYKFVCLSHNTVRGAAGGAILMAELLAREGYFDF